MFAYVKRAELNMHFNKMELAKTDLDEVETRLLMCFVTSEYEFNDFISEMKGIDEEAFLLALAATNSLCRCFGVNEEDEMEQYLKNLNGEYTVIFNDRYQEGTYYIFPN